MNAAATSPASAPPKAALIVGAGDATGGAIARRFAREGFITCVSRRQADKLVPLVEAIQAEGGQAHAFGSDARDEAAVTEMVTQIERDIAPLEVVVFNIGANVRFKITDTTGRVYRKVWEMGALAGFLVGRAGEAPSCSPAPRPACAAAPGSRPLRAPSTPCVRWPRAWRASSGRRGCTWRTW
jgi:NAD(P)-dependent dehydrogenase (short-subunit alcohol dehydrogenase family)